MIQLTYDQNNMFGPAKIECKKMVGTNLAEFPAFRFFCFETVKPWICILDADKKVKKYHLKWVV